MRNRPSRMVALLTVIPLLLTACAASGPASLPPVKQLEVARRPQEANFSQLARRPYSLTKPEGRVYEIDLRHHDLSGEDLSEKAAILVDYATFDTDTTWPAKLPRSFDPQRILETGRDPGLGLRDLHRKGITGEGVRVAFLDQSLLVDHVEYKERVERYREIGKVGQAQMHGSAVLSFLAGRSSGSAPGVSVTYYAINHFAGENQFTWSHHATAIHQILDENKGLPPKQQIRVIGVSWGYSPEYGGYEEIKAAVARAKQEGVLVLTSAVEMDYTFKFHGLDRHPLADPNQTASYRPGSWWADRFYANPEESTDRILVPMDSRTSAGPTGVDDYVFYRSGGWSWSIPYLVGVYALGLQVKPDLTPDQFYQAALETGSWTTFKEAGKEYKVGPILNPPALIKRLQGS